MEHTAELRIALVGGAPLIQAGMAAVLAQDDRFRAVLQAPDVRGAVEGLAQTWYDVVVLNTETPRVEVVTLLQCIAAQVTNGMAPRVLALTDEESPEEALATLRAGAQGYGVRRHLWPEDLRAGVLAVGRGLAWICPFVTGSLVARATPAEQAGTSHRHAAFGRLSPRETDVLRLAATGAGDERIASALYLSPNSVKTYWQRIRVKLSARSRGEAIRQAVTNGVVPDRRQRPT